MAGSKPSHRQRLIDAMIVVAARHGYGGASVSRVIGQAGVSRATFYEHFAGREDCFLGAYRELVGRVEREVELGRDRGGRPREIIAGLVGGAGRDPDAACLILIEALAAGEAVRQEHEALLGRVTASIESYIGDPPDGSPRLEIPARALLGGVSGVIAIRVFRGGTGRLSELLDDLVTWLESYAVADCHQWRSSADWGELGKMLGAPATPLPDPLLRPLPRGRSALPAALVAGEQRRRVLAAVARVAREKGYGGMTVADIVATAGVTRETFYEQFRNKDDAFLAAQADALETSISTAAGKIFSEEPWPVRVWNAARAALSYVASVPDLGHLDFVESYALGADAVRRSFESRMAYTLFLQEGYRQRPKAADLPRLSSEAVASAIFELVRQYAVEDRTDRVLELLPQVVFVALAPFIGAAEAAGFVDARVAVERNARG